MQPPLIAIVGAPNSGKSTLFNRLVGRRKALVHHAPGMTRDVNEESCDWRGRRVLLADTGGLFPAGEVPFAGEVMRSVLAAAAAADVLIFLVDGRAGLTPVDEQLARTFRSTGRPVVLAVNKLDVPGREEPAGEFHRLGFPTLVAIS
ncbi:MAG TPA: GTPase, partial [Candidatus Polarisedimenticolia bacterium]|nr:GTPase [Candidatus Polarisedimenticolia bacterium]